MISHLASNTSTETHAHSEQRLSANEIAQILSIYLPDHQYVSNARITASSLECALGLTKYPYTTHSTFDYITAPTATLFVCQLAYVLVGGLTLRNPELALSLGGLSWDTFLRRRNEALLRFTNITTRFSSAVPNTGNTPAKITTTQSRRHRGLVHCRMSFTINACISGEVHGVIVTQS